MAKIKGWRKSRDHCWVTCKGIYQNNGKFKSLFKVELIPITDLNKKNLGYEVVVHNNKLNRRKYQKFQNYKCAYKYATAYRKVWSQKNGGKK
jgi:hypothetical protein